MTTAEVMLWGTKIGTAAFDRDTGLGSFEYSPAFLSSGIEVSPIAMPLSRRVYLFPELAGQSFHGLPGLLADSLRKCGDQRLAAEPGKKSFFFRSDRTALLYREPGNGRP